MPLLDSVQPLSSLKAQQVQSFLATRVEEFDVLLEGIARGAITEIFGAPTSGRTTFLHRFLSTATRSGEYCCLIDGSNAFDPASTQTTAIDMRHLLWVRCHDVTDKRRVEKAIKCADLFIHSGGWGVVVLDLSDISPEWVRRLPTSYWYRFRRAVENTPTALVVMEREPYVKTCASLAIEMSAGQALWSGAHKDFRVLSSVRYGTIPKKPMKHERPSFSARALA